MKTANTLKEALAREFSHLLTEEIGAANMLKVIASNANDGVGCASHDYCDANVVMGQAFENVVGREFEFAGENHESDMNLFNEAWNIAKAHKFFIDPPNA